MSPIPPPLPRSTPCKLRLSTGETVNVRRWLCLGLLLVTRLEAQQGVLDLTTLANYAAQPVPAYININKDNTPGDNAITNAGATLGRVLFYDKRLSRNDTISCSSCHQQSKAFGDSATASTGVNGTTGRHSMRLINSRFATESRFFWDERADTLEDQTTRPIQDHVEMGFSGTSGDPSFADLVTKLSAIEEYRVLFALMFGDATITEARVQSALAQFVRSIQSFDSRYDVGRAQVNADNVDFPNFSASENTGKQLFLAPPNQGGAGCAGCHRAPEFDIDPNSRNNGITASLSGGTDLTNTRAPSLRDMANPTGTLNGGLMHDGSRTSLLQVIAHYAAIPGDNANLDQRLRRPGGNVQTLNLSTQQRNDLVAFLLTLTGSAVYTDARWSDPFDASGQLDLIIISSSAISFQANGNGTATLRCNVAPGLNYQLQSAPTPAGAWTTVTTVTADANGQLENTVAIGAGAAFFRFTYTPPAS